MSDFWKDFHRKLDLDEDDKGHVKDLLGSRGWHVLTHKVWPAHEYLMMSSSKTRGNDPTGLKQAGKYEGIRLCQELAERIGRPKPEQPKSQPQRKITHLQRENQRGSKPL